MKRRIHQNVWGNWYGYEGTKRVESFGTDELEAERWLKTGKRDEAPDIEPVTKGKNNE